MSKPTSNDYIVFYAHQWRKSGKAAVSAPDGEKTAPKQAHRSDILRLERAVDLAIRNGAPVIQPDSGKGKP